MQSLRWDDITANNIIVFLDAYQHPSGFVAPVLETPQIKINYVAT